MIRLYLDVHVRGPVTSALRSGGIDCLTAQEDGLDAASDEAVLRRATELNRLLVTYDEDLLEIAARFQQAGTPFAGIIKSHCRYVSIQTEIDQLRLICSATTREEHTGTVLYLPIL